MNNPIQDCLTLCKSVQIHSCAISRIPYQRAKQKEEEIVKTKYDASSVLL